MDIKNDKGISRITLLIVIIVILVIGVVAINYGNSTIKKEQLESLKTNMLLIQAKAKEYCEQANFLQGTHPTDETKQKAKEYLEGKLKNLTPNSEINGVTYEYTSELNLEDFTNMGLKDINTEDRYCIGFDISNHKIEIYTLKGYKDDEGNTRMSLSELENL